MPFPSQAIRLVFFVTALLLYPPLSSARTAKPAGADRPLFTDVAKSSGLDFVHFNGMSGEYYYPEMIGQGCAFLDYDNDGDLDVYLVQGSVLGPGKTMKDVLFPSKEARPRHRLFRNDLTINDRGERVPRFVDVTEESGIRITDYGMGVATGDFNNDGWIDMYVTGYGASHMLYNNGNGTFTDVTEKTGTGNSLWGTSAAALDYDRDGWLDLYVADYVRVDLKENKKCYTKSSRRDYCGPAVFPPQRDRLFHNRGDGTFEDVTYRMLADYRPGPGLGVAAIDANRDGWPDILVANDGAPNQLWINKGGRQFVDEALFAGAAVNSAGRPEANMGVAVGDFDRDGDEDIFITHLMGETNTLFVNDGTGFFEDRTPAFGLSAPSFPYTSFGTGWLDYDNDGWPDLLVLNGAVQVIERLALAGDPYPLHQPNQLFHNEGGKRFLDVSDRAGQDIRISEVSRGAAFGDVDNDGDIDVLVANNNGPVRLLRNNVGQDKKWLGLRLVDAKGKRDMIGALAGVRRKGLPTLWQRVHTDGSYCSAGDPRLLFGLGGDDTVEDVEIVWPDGKREVWRKPALMRYTTLRKGSVNRENNRP
jgi:hypothetical protein